MSKIWRTIPSYPNYEVSSLGAVRSKTRITSHGHKRAGQKMKQLTQDSGHMWVGLTRNGKQHKKYVHALVLEAFVGARPDSLICRHLDNNPKNNQVANLAWGTQSQNMKDRKGHGTNDRSNKTHCPHGHHYAGSNLRIYQGGRYCRACGYAHAALRYAKKAGKPELDFQVVSNQKFSELNPPEATTYPKSEGRKNS